MGLSMRKILFGLLGFFIVGAVLCEGTRKPTLSSYDYDSLEKLYKYDSNGSLSQELDNLAIDYYLRILSQHIKILEHEIAEKRSWFGRSDVRFFFAQLTFEKVFRSIYMAAVLSFSIYLIEKSAYKEFQQMRLGKFSQATVPNFMLRMLRYIRFTRAEKQRLNNRHVDKIYYASASYLRRKSYTAREQEKIKYLARKLAPIQTIVAMFMCGAISLCFFVLLVGFLYISIPSVRNGMMRPLAQCLERDKRLYELLKNAKTSYA